MRALKDHLYEQVARIGKALASPKRLELIELLCQGEKSVDTLATQAGISVTLASSHLKALRAARLVESRRDGKFVFCRLAGPGVSQLWVALRSEAEERLVELQVALSSMIDRTGALDGFDGRALLEKAEAGQVVVLDVRPTEEYAAAHLPYARSLPIAELRKRLRELPAGVPVVAYCRGPFCLMAKDAVRLLRRKGRAAFHLADGVAEWRARGLPLESV